MNTTICAALQGLHFYRSHGRACALGFATPPLRGLKMHVSLQELISISYRSVLSTNIIEWENGLVLACCAYGLRYLDKEKILQGSARANNRTSSRSHSADLSIKGSRNRARVGVTGSHPHVVGRTAADISDEAGAIHQWEIIASLTGRRLRVRQEILGRHLRAASAAIPTFTREGTYRL
jgi:hypothetical protein